MEIMTAARGRVERAKGQLGMHWDDAGGSGRWVAVAARCALVALRSRLVPPPRPQSARCSWRGSMAWMRLGRCSLVLCPSCACAWCLCLCAGLVVFLVLDPLAFYQK
jgi:hypothetical protein